MPKRKRGLVSKSTAKRWIVENAVGDNGEEIPVRVCPFLGVFWFFSRGEGTEIFEYESLRDAQEGGRNWLNTRDGLDWEVLIRVKSLGGPAAFNNAIHNADGESAKKSNWDGTSNIVGLEFKTVCVVQRFDGKVLQCQVPRGHDREDGPEGFGVGAQEWPNYSGFTPYSAQYGELGINGARKEPRWDLARYLPWDPDVWTALVRLKSRVQFASRQLHDLMKSPELPRLLLEVTNTVPLLAGPVDGGLQCGECEEAWGSNPDCRTCANAVMGSSA